MRRALCRKTGPPGPGAGANCERKKYITKYRKYHIKPHEKLLRFGPTLQKGGTSNFKFEQAHTRGKTWWEDGPHSLPQKNYTTRPREFQNLKPSAARLYFIFLSHFIMPLLRKKIWCDAGRVYGSTVFHATRRIPESERI